MIIDEYPQTTRLYEQLVQMIEAKIINGEFQFGDRLPTENEMAAQFRVSRTVIREAMKALKEKGWVETRVGKGTFVVDNVDRGVAASLDILMRMNPEQGYVYLVELREVIEPEIAALTAIRAQKEQIQQIQQAVERMDCALVDPEDMSSFLDADNTFHKLISESSGNPLIQTILNPIVALMRSQQAYYLFNLEGSGRRSQHYHKLIMSAIAKRDATAARKHMLDHIRQVRIDMQR